MKVVSLKHKAIVVQSGDMLDVQILDQGEQVSSRDIDLTPYENDPEYNQNGNLDMDKVITDLLKPITDANTMTRRITAGRGVGHESMIILEYLQ